MLGALGPATFATVAAQPAPQLSSQLVAISNGTCKARITANGIADISLGSEVFTFENLPPFLIRTTTIAGGQIAQADYWGHELSTTQKHIVQLSQSQCVLTWRGCALPGVVGAFDLIYQYEVLPTRSAVAVRGRVQNSSLRIGIQAVGYRQYLAVDSTPASVTGGFTGAAHLSFALLPLSNWNLQHPFLLTGGYHRLGKSRVEEFITTRSSETTLIAASHHANRRNGILLTRDVRFDVDNVGRETGLFGSNPIGAAAGARFGAGVLSYLPNDDRPGNGGAALDVGAGLVYDFFVQENAAEPYWDAIRAYRDLYVEPLLVGLDKSALRPSWGEHCLFMTINVSSENQVRVGPVLEFLDQFFQYYDQVTDIALLLWGATETERFTPAPGLQALMSGIRSMEVARQKRIHTSLYYLPTGYVAAADGGSRLSQVCLDPFGNPSRFQISPTEYGYIVNTAAQETQAFFSNWVGSTVLPTGSEGVYFDDAIRNRHVFASHYVRTAALQGRLPDLVRGCLEHMLDPQLGQKGRYVITELGTFGRSVPGNVIQGVANLEVAGAFFLKPQHELKLLPFLNDIAGGKHYLAGYAGVLLHSWLNLEDFNNTLYYPTQIVRGLVPLLTPLAIGERYLDFFQMCRDRVVNCDDPRFRALGAYSRFANASMGFFARHASILARWRREPFPGTHDIPKRIVKFLPSAQSPAYQLTVDELPFGCFSSPDLQSMAVALANPHEAPRQVRLNFARRLYGMQFNGRYRVVLEAQNGARTVLAQASSGELEAAFSMPAREFALVMLEPVK